MGTYVISGNVPSQAATASVGVRVNSEGSLVGPCDVTLSEIRFDVDSVNQVPNGNFSSNGKLSFTGWRTGGQSGPVEQTPVSSLHIKATSPQTASILHELSGPGCTVVPIHGQSAGRSVFRK